MIFAASIVTFPPEEYSKAKKALEGLKKAEIHYEDAKQGKIIIVIEGEDNNEVENVRLELQKEDSIESVDHYAFYFGEEVEKTMKGEPIKDFDIESAFKKHINRK